MSKAVMAVHVLAGVAWMGGILFLNLVVPAAQRAALVRPFLRVAWAAIAALLVTGYYLFATAYQELGDLLKPRGVALAMKIGAAMLLAFTTLSISMDAASAAAGRSAAAAGGDEPSAAAGAAAPRLARQLGIGLALCLVIAAALGFLAG